MSRKYSRLGLVFASTALCMSYVGFARADVEVSEAQYLCSEGTHRFELAPYWTIVPENSHFPDPPVSEGFTGITTSVRLSCALGRHTLKASIHVYEPSGGMCMGGGKVTVESLRIGTTELWSPQDLAWNCDPAQPGLMRVRVIDGADAVTIERCYGHKVSRGKVEEDQCKSEQVRLPESSPK